MWGSIVNKENEAVTSAGAYMTISALGAGQLVNLSTRSPIVKFIAAVSPVRYSVERVFRRVVSTSYFETPLLHFFGFTLGDYECAKAMIMMSVTFFLVGWAALVYRSNRL